MGLVDFGILGDAARDGLERVCCDISVSGFWVGIPKVGVERRDEVAEIGVWEVDMLSFHLM